MSDRDFEALRDVARESLLGRAAAGVTQSGLAAWNESRAVGAFRGTVSRFESMDQAARIRIVALVAAWMGIGHGALVRIMPAYVAPGLPSWWVAAFVLTALAVAAAAGPLAMAWSGSTLASVRRRTSASRSATTPASGPPTS